MSPNTDWTGHSGPERGKALTWQRIEPRYYRLRGTDVYITDVRGSPEGSAGAGQPPRLPNPGRGQHLHQPGVEHEGLRPGDHQTTP